MRVRVESLKDLELMDKSGFIYGAITHEINEKKRTGKYIDSNSVVSACMSDLKEHSNTLYNLQHSTEFVNLGTNEMACWVYNNEKEQLQWNTKEELNNSIKIYNNRIFKISNFLMRLLRNS